ncbi:UDP-N-acetylglucosamine 2-epimerase [Dyadobacter psychrotolerans]|uniref:UDP-N-acetylglucosamine 2-epimerase (Hydrolyzing) n=1 Tax=Dyadobacter psychrotolerans TaxID=2541721 RepID=A0A4R5DLS8_9BACT|nr:UDP-N-acetylglucosamine 2-epimerase [Dyadobacter psychrotolerans]TDE11603.1 UDP-N-acetylglucosamine 2-epimerase (hydrolyzing) [Dyadobacter psychrotolerans]
MKRKICVVITARASYSRIKTALKAIQQHPDLELQLVLSGSALLEKYGSVVNHMLNDGFKITARLSNVLENGGPADSVKTVGLASIELSTLFETIKPDIIVTIADRYETMATAVAAAYMNIPLAHIQGGEITGNIDDKVRNAITQLADIHLVATDTAKQRVLKMGADADHVYKVGCPSIDIAMDILHDSTLDFDPFEQYGGVGKIFDPQKKYIVVMQHSVTTEYVSAAFQTAETLRAIENLGINTFWFWPNPDAGTETIAKTLRTYREMNPDTNIHFFKNMNPRHFLKLLKNANCLVGNSSVGLRECSLLGVPVVNIGSRQNGRERGNNVLDAGYDFTSITNAVQIQIRHGHYEPNPIYGTGNSGKKIAFALANTSLATSDKPEWTTSLAS